MVCSTGFGAKVTLNQSFQAALSRNEVVLQGQEQVNQANDRVSQGVGAVLPEISLNLLQQMQPEPDDAIARQFSPGQQTTINFMVVQPLFRGLREFNGLSQLKRMRNAQEATQEQRVNTLYQDTANTYLQVLSLEQDLKNLKEQNTLYEKRVSELGSRAKRGESNQTDVITAESTQASLIAETELVQGNLEVARDNFFFLTGLPRESEFTDPQLNAEKVEAVEKYLDRLEKRADVRANIERYEAADKGVSMAWGTHLPRADVVGNYYLKRPGFLADLKWDVGFKVTVPLFEGGATQAKVREAVSIRKEAELELAKGRRAAQQEVRSIHKRLLARLNQIKSLKRSAELSQKSSTLLQRDYRRGLARNIDIQLALTEYRITQRNLDQAYYTAQSDFLQLQVASGLAPEPEGKGTP